VKSVDEDQLVFTPSNIDDFTENLSLPKAFVEKYFEEGDMVRIIQGTYKGETGVITEVGVLHSEVKTKTDIDKSIHPTIRLDKTQREMKVNKIHLKLKGEHDNDFDRIKHLGKKNQNHQSTNIYSVGEIINFNTERSYGYIIAVTADMLKVVTNRGDIKKVRLTEVDKKMNYDPKVFSRDVMGNILSIDDVVKIIKNPAEDKKMAGKKGIIKNICKGNLLFLWDPKDLA